jgi:hypothetical protein
MSIVKVLLDKSHRNYVNGIAVGLTIGYLSTGAIDLIICCIIAWTIWSLMFYASFLDFVLNLYDGIQKDDI